MGIGRQDPACRHRALRRYAVAVLATAAATLVKFLFPDLIGRDAPVAVYLGAVMLAAWFGGTGPGLLATALSVLAGAYWFAAPYDSMRVAELDMGVRIVLGALEGTVISLLAGALRRETAAARRRTDDLAKSNAELVREIEARAKAEAALRDATDQLVQAQKLRAVGTLAGGIAHDFNNLLAVILNYADLTLLRLPADHALCENLQEIRDAGERGRRLTQQLLTFARKGPATPRVIDLRDTVGGLERMLRMILGDGIDLLVSREASPARVRVDPTQMEQVLTNLAMNARDAMPHGGRLAIDIARVELDADAARPLGLPAGDYVRLTVSDTGVGICAEARERIFEPLFTTKEPGRGSGLGLAIVHGVITGAGGVIEVASSPGVGTSFTVHLPGTREPVAVTGAAAGTVGSSATTA